MFLFMVGWWGERGADRVFSGRVAEWVENLCFEDLPEPVIRQAKNCLLDWLACVLAASKESFAVTLKELAVEMGGNEQATLIPFGIKTSCLNAALVNGTLAHMIEYDDIFKEGIYHPGAPIIAAALATAEYKKAIGKRLIEGIVAGYEISTRIAQFVNPEHYRYWHTTGTIGSLGAAIAASKIMGLNKREIIWAFGNAGTMAAGLQQTLSESTNGKPLHAGKAALNGVLASLLAVRGHTGAEGILDGEKGLIRAMSGKTDFSGLSKLLSDLGKKFNILNTTFKYYASCGHTHSAIDAALELVQKHELKPNLMESISVKTYSVAVDVAGKSNPKNSYEAKFSIPYCVAAAIKFGKVGLEQFKPDYLTDEEIKCLIAITNVQRDPLADMEFPNKRRSTVEVRDKRGRLFVASSDYRKGDPEKPLSEEELRDKFFSLGRISFSEEKLCRLWDRILKIEEGEVSLLFS